MVFYQVVILVVALLLRLTSCRVWNTTAVKTIRKTAESTFGHDVSMTEDFLIAGGGGKMLKVYIYERDGTTMSGWSDSAVAQFTGTESGSRYGRGLAITSSFAFIAAPTGSIPRVFIYSRNAETNVWDTNPTVTITQPRYQDYTRHYFGGTLDADDHYLIVGDYAEAKLVYIYAFSASTNQWGTSPVTTIDGYTSLGNFGRSIALKGDFFIVGASGSFKACIFGRDTQTGMWGKTAVVEIYGYTDQIFFGAGVAISENYAAVGAGHPNSGSWLSANKVFVFARDPTTNTWSTTAVTIIDGYIDKGSFGYRLGMTDNSLVVGAFEANEAFIFERQNGIWGKAATKTLSRGAISRYFGVHVAVTEAYLAVGDSGRRDVSIFIHDCGEGQYLPSDSVSCLLCDPGKYSTAIKAVTESVCSACSPGKYSGSGGAPECTSCPVGRFEAGTSSSECTACPAGRYVSSTGSDDTSVCVECRPGTYTAGDGASKCINCPAGTYGPEPLAGSIDKCIKCGLGRYSPTPGVTSEAACQACPSGKHAYEEGSIDCRGCSSGKFQKTDAETSTVTCQACGHGTYSNGETEFCAKCRAGRYADSEENALCTLCSPGRYTGANEEGATTCEYACPAGRYSRKQGSSSQGDCQSCPPGTYQFTEGSSDCLPCSPGSLSSDPGQERCTLCPINSFSREYGSKSCLQCPSGKIAPSNGSIACIYPTECPIGQYSQSGYSPCQLCPPGSISTQSRGSTGCERCQDGKISRAAGQAICEGCQSSHYPNPTRTDCTACGVNEVPSYDNTSDIWSCRACGEGQQASRGECEALRKCNPGEFSESGYGPFCILCPQGKYSSITGTRGNCSACTYGKYCQNNGNVTPKDCEDNQYTVEEGSSLKTDCLNCPPGHIPLDDKSACQVCQDGYYASGGNCLKETEQLRDSTIGSVFKNKGAPLYILAMLVIAIALVSVVTYYSKAQSVALLQQPMLSHVAKFSISYAGVISEFILITGMLDSGVQIIYAYGVLMLLSRTVVASPPGIILMWAVFILQDKVDPKPQQRTLKYHLDDETIHKNIKTFAVVLFLGCFEPPLLSFLPWYETPFSRSAQFPNLFLMRGRPQ